MSVLTVGDARQFTEEGGIVALFEDHHEFRFDLNLGNARRAGVSIRPELVKAAADIVGAVQ
jgi:hypothetical protein